MFARSWETPSDSEEEGAEGIKLVLISPEMAALVKEKLSSDQQTLSRRNAAEARRFPVCRSTMASSIRPRWQQA